MKDSSQNVPGEASGVGVAEVPEVMVSVSLLWRDAGDKAEAEEESLPGMSGAVGLLVMNGMDGWIAMETERSRA